MATKIEQASQEIIDHLRAMQAREVGGQEIDWPALLPVIGDLIVRIIEALESCRETAFSRLAKNVGFLGGLRFRREANRVFRDHGVQNMLRTTEVFQASRTVAAGKADEWLDDLANEPRRPDWGAL